jgi:hypothetical protein
VIGDNYFCVAPNKYLAKLASDFGWQYRDRAGRMRDRSDILGEQNEEEFHVSSLGLRQ